MAKVQHTCTGCVPIDSSILETYIALQNAIASSQSAASTAADAAEAASGAATSANDAATSANNAALSANAAAAAANAAGITQAEASVDANTGVPSVDVSLVNKKLTLAFHNVKGEKGDKGDRGDGAVPIVNDLTTGGTDAALSAEMGKTLNNTKQANLVSGTNIKTVNGESLLGSGNIVAGDPNAVKYTEQTLTDAQKTQARTNIGAGTGTYTKAAAGIPKTDLESGVQASLDLADTAIQARPSGEVDPTITPAEYATQEELSQLDQEVDDLDLQVNGGEVVQTISKTASATDTRIARNGSITTSSASGFGVYSYPVVAGKTYSIAVPAMSNSYSSVFAFTNVATVTTTTPITFPETRIDGPVSNYSAEVTVPTGYDHLLVCFNTASGDPTVTGPVAVSGMTDQIAALETAAAGLRTDVDSLLVKSSVFGLDRVVIDGYYLNGNSALVERASSQVITYRNIPSGVKKIRLAGNAIGGSTRTVSFFNSVEILPVNIIYGRTYTGSIDRFLEVPEGTKLIAIDRFSSEVTVDILDVIYDIDTYGCIYKPFSFNGKTAMFFGDSITYGVMSSADGLSTDADKCYAKLLCNHLGMTILNKAVSGSLFTKDNAWDIATIKDTVLATSDAADFIFIAGGCNDYWRSVEIGDLDSASEYELCGALNAICEYLQTNYSEAVVSFITPINSVRTWKTSKNAGAGTYPMDDYRNAIYRIATKYGYNVIDGSEVGFPTKAGDYAELMIYDGVHPTELGHQMYAKTLAGKLL